MPMRLPILLLLAVLAACAAPRAETPVRAPGEGEVTILVLLDGFRPDYLDRGITPNLSALADDGVRGSIVPVFPTVTFPNHYTQVTGLYPDHHGILGNAFEEAATAALFSTADRALMDEPRWWSAVPIWASAEEQGVRTAMTFWFMYGRDRQGREPPHIHKLEKDLPPTVQTDRFLTWFDAPASERPKLALLYFYDTDSAGHEYGPAAPETEEVVRTVDAEVGRLVAGLRARGIWDRTNVVFTADHGMAPSPPSQVMVLEDLAPSVLLRTVGEGPYAYVYPARGGEAAALGAALEGRHAHGECWRREAMPEKFHFGSNPNAPPVICVADSGWRFLTRGSAQTSLGNHGYAPADPEMAALFIGHGPAFRRGYRAAPIEAVDVYGLLARLAGVRPEPNDGDPARSAPMLR